MSTITGPKVQMPASLSQMFETDQQGNILGMKPDWGQFFHALQGITFNASRSGPSASRPTSTISWRYIGMPFYDTSLSTTIYLQSINPDSWVGHYQTHKSNSQNFTVTTMVNDSEINIPVQSQDHYVGRMFADIGAALRSTGVKVSVTAPTGAIGSYMVGLMLDAASAGNVDTLRASTMGQVLDFTAGSINTALNGFMEIAFHVINSTTAGSINFQFGQSTFSSDPLTVRVGSQLSADKAA